MALWTDRSVPFGKYWRSSPLVFSHGGALPWCVRVTEVDVDVGGDTDLFPVAHLGALVPGQ